MHLWLLSVSLYPSPLPFRTWSHTRGRKEVPRPGPLPSRRGEGAALRGLETGVDGRIGEVLDVDLHLLRHLLAEQHQHQLQRLVQAGGDAGAGDARAQVVRIGPGRVDHEA